MAETAAGKQYCLSSLSAAWVPGVSPTASLLSVLFTDPSLDTPVSTGPQGQLVALSSILREKRTVEGHA